MPGKFILIFILSVFFSFKSRSHYDSVYSSVPYFENKYSFKWNKWGTFDTTEDMNNRKISTVMIGFSTKKPYTIDEIREIYVEIVSKVLSDINSNNDYKDSYKSFPLKASNLSVSIMYFGDDYYCVNQDKGFSMTTCVDKIIYYRDRLSKNCPDQETYQEALKKVRSSKVD